MDYLDKLLKKGKKNYIKYIIGLFIIIYIVINGSVFSNANDQYKDIKKAFSNNTSDTKKVSGNITVSFLDVGQGDSILINKNDKYVLIDAGDEDHADKLVSYLQRLGIEKFDYVVSTHPHEDHIGGMDDIIKNFSISTFYMNDVLSTSKTYEDMLDALDVKSISYDVLKEDSTFSFDDATFKVLSIEKNDDNLNDSSIVLKLEYGKKSFLFMGDASTSIEKKILNKELKSDVLKVGHHGSSYSSSNEFIDKVGPKYAVISVGKNNIYKHPSNNVIDLLNNKNIKIYRTDTDGNITFTSDGENLSIETMDSGIEVSTITRKVK